MSTALQFSALREANLARLSLFKNARGGPAHSQQDGSDWSLSDWLTAVCGELGEAANVIKKVNRADFTLEEARDKLAQEFADVMIYLDILAYRCGIDLGLAVIDTYNRKSEQLDLPCRLTTDRYFEVPPF